jgi:NAD+ diphosphatase
MHGGKLHPIDLWERSARAGFADNGLNRMSERRDDVEFLDRLRRSTTSRTLVLSGEAPVLKRVGGGYDALFTFSEAAGLGVAIQETAFLGCDADGALFATLIESEATESDSPPREDIALIDLRAIATQGLVSLGVIGALGQAKSLMSWHARHRFCSNCGAPSQVSAAGWRRTCAVCKTDHFPRTDPVVIMLVTEGGDCLLGRQHRFPPSVYSCLAGFVEAGETLEDAVRREVLEEAGIATGVVDYLASQPWPFPNSLMIGCIAHALSRDLTIDGKELEDARWFSRSDVLLMLDKAHPAGFLCPPKIAIANLLTTAWATGEIS